MAQPVVLLHLAGSIRRSRRRRPPRHLLRAGLAAAAAASTWRPAAPPRLAGQSCGRSAPTQSGRQLRRPQIVLHHLSRPGCRPATGERPAAAAAPAWSGNGRSNEPSWQTRMSAGASEMRVNLMTSVDYARAPQTQPSVQLELEPLSQSLFPPSRSAPFI